MVRLAYLGDAPVEISLSLSSVCNARCIWCPIGQGQNTSQKSKFMSIEIVDKILKDIDGKQVASFFFADMGEPLLNPQFKEIITKIRAAHPESLFWLSSNFFLMNDDMARFVIDAGFNSVGLDIDGITEEGYYAVKRLPFKKVWANFLNFVSLREENIAKSIAMPCINVSIVTQPRYYTEIRETEKITIPDETRDVIAILRGVLESCDTIQASVVASWAERRRWNRPRTLQNGLCANIHVLGRKCCIDTDGNVISCCQDFDSELKFGNVMDNTIFEIWNGEKHKRFLSLMASNKWAEIGMPCANCQD